VAGAAEKELRRASLYGDAGFFVVRAAAWRTRAAVNPFAVPAMLPTARRLDIRGLSGLARSLAAPSASRRYESENLP